VIRAAVLAAALVMLPAAGPAMAAPAGAADPTGSPRPSRALAPEALREAAGRLAEFGSRAVGAEGHAAARSYAGGRMLLAGLGPILTDTFTVESDLPAGQAGRATHAGRATREDGAARVACGSVVAFAFATPMGDVWADMKSQAEQATFARPLEPDLAAALAEAARAEGVSRLTPFDVFKRPSALFPEAVVRCMLERIVRREAGRDGSGGRAAVVARMLRRLARSHEAVLVAGSLDAPAGAGAEPIGPRGTASLVALLGAARHVACENPQEQARTLVVAALDACGHGAAGARSLADLVADRPDAAGGGAEDRQLAALLGPSQAAREAAALAGRLEAGPEAGADAGPEADTLARAEDAVVRLLRREPYGVRLAVLLDLEAPGRGVTVHVVGGGARTKALRRWLAAAAARAGAATVAEAPAGPPAGQAGRATHASASAFAEAGVPAMILRSRRTGGKRPDGPADGARPDGFDALSARTSAAAALLVEVLAAEDWPGDARP